MSLNVNPDKIVVKGGSLMGPMEGGMPSQVECNDGKITRIRPYFYDKENIKENYWEIEAHGKKFRPPEKSLISPFALTYKKRVYSPNRVKYPLKRVDWDPNGERNPQNRGKSKFVRISWDEAAQLVADELKRMQNTYGLESVLCCSEGHGEGKIAAPSHGCPTRLLSLMGPYCSQTRNLDSWEGWHLGARHVWGCEPVGEMMPMANTIPDIAKHSSTLLFWGCDLETTPLGVVSHMSSQLAFWFTELGINCIYVDPAFNFAAAVHADKWIPILPNTDAAMQLAIAYIWLTEGTYDKEYIAPHTYGFEKFVAYVMGEEDGIPKTPKWASEKCGVPSYTIKAFARDWAKQVVSICHGNGGSYIRGPYATEPARLEVMLLSMQGLGSPGVHQVKMIEWNFGGLGLGSTPRFQLPYQPEKNYPLPSFCSQTCIPAPDEMDDDFLLNTGELSPEMAARSPVIAEKLKAGYQPGQTIPRCFVHRAILEPEIEFWGGQVHPNRQRPTPGKGLLSTSKYQFRKLTFPKPGMSRIHMIYTDSPCSTTCWNDGNMLIRAFQDPSIECIVAQHPWMENDCYFADIVLPVVTKHEMVDICPDCASGQYPTIYLEDKSCEPIGESLSDLRVCAEIAKKISPELYERYVGSLTDEEIVEAIYKASGAEEVMSFEELKEKKVCILPIDKKAQEHPAGLKQFHDDPKNHPLTTPTGLLEFSSSEIEEKMPDDEERPPVPHWIEKGPAHDERLSSERAKDYPLLLMSNHGRWRMHAQCDDITWNREVMTMKVRGKDGYQYEPMWISYEEAEKRGIQTGDIVKIYNERGAVLCGAYVTHRLIEHTVYVDHGSRVDPIIPGELDRGGAINLISPTAVTSTHATGMATSHYLVEVAKVTDEEMEGWKRDYPEAFERKFDYAAGPCLEGWLIEE